MFRVTRDADFGFAKRRLKILARLAAEIGSVASAVLSDEIQQTDGCFGRST